MKVLDHSYYAWFLFEEDESLFLDANCNHSAFGYTFAIKLNLEEVGHFRNKGRAYLDELAHKIHYSAPIMKGSKSPYRDRRVSKEFSEKMSAAVRSWREKQK